ncbi:MAG: ABC transporter ATP-binding protein/permease [Clostridia bacterium]|nr:ABC transporter ATP-binding protein/permease [Clostridia bacterium]
MSKSRVPKGTVKKLISYIGHYMPFLIITAVLAALGVVFSLLLPILFGRAIDLLAAPGKVERDALGRLIIRILAMIIGAGGSQWIMTAVNNRITYNIVRDIRAEAFDRLCSMPLSYIDTHRHGDIVSRIIADVDQLADGLLLGFTTFFTGILTILGTLGFMFYLNPAIAAAVALLTPLSLFAARFIARKTFRYAQNQMSIRGEQTAFIDETLGNQKLVKAFSREDSAAQTFDEINDRLSKASLKAVFFSSLTNPTTRFINSVIYAAVALIGTLTIIGAAFASGAGLTVGILSSLLSYANQYTKPFNEISGVVTELQSALAAAARIYELIEAQPEQPDAPDAAVLDDVQGEVNLKNAAFSYTPERELITNFSLNVRPGQKIAIVGPTGCGKTTVINLLMRFYDVNSGCIEIDGHDIREVTRASLRKSYGMVLQDTWLRHGTVRENISMNRPGITDEDVIKAAKAAHAHSFIKRLPDGYDTVISGDGGGISQGQKQLICIARIMVQLPPMLILDEATSSIDSRTEMRVQRAFGKMMKGRTSFIVAHRLSTIRDADLIIVMNDGHIIETGSHDELIASGGFYYRLYNSSFESAG